MARPPSAAAEKPLHWVGSSKRDFLAFPDQVISDMGYALGLAQLGAKHPHAKPLEGRGAGCVRGGRKPRDSDTYRVLYTVRFEGVKERLRRGAKGS